MITTLLFDADGVIQSTADTFMSDLRSLVPLDQADEFTQQVFALEKPSMAGRADFREDLRRHLEQWQVVQSVDQVLKIWHQIDRVPGIVSMLSDLRRHGYKVCLATNQQANRMMFMRQQLMWDDHFDIAFYSCELGATKPSSHFFESIVESLDTEAGQVLFIDDSLANVEAAQNIGLKTIHFSIDGKLNPVVDLLQVLKLYLPLGESK